MTIEGKTIRELRTKLGISQARLSEISVISQHTLSGFELGKNTLAPDELAKIISILENPSRYEGILLRKKRYRSQTYNGVKKDISRSAYCVQTIENAQFVKEINKRAPTNLPRFKGLSLFAGIGGFSCGFSHAGFDIKGFVEIDEKLAKIYSENFPEVERLGGDILKVKNPDVIDFLKRHGEIDVVIGGPPCQGFSLSGKRNVGDPRNYLFNEYMRVIDIVRPKVAVIENVRLLTSMKSKNGGFVKDEILAALSQHGYRSSLFEINAVNYGVPQHRARVVFIAVRDDLNFSPTCPPPQYSEVNQLFDELKPLRSFGDACSDLPYIESGESSDVPYHKAVSHPDHVIEWLWNVPQGASAHDNEDPALCPPSGYNTTYKRQIWNEPASTVQTTFGMISGCRNVHPVATRSLSIREASRIQSFPDDYKFVGSLGTIRTGIGNAVPPLLAFNIAQHLRPRLLDFVEVPRL